MTTDSRPPIRAAWPVLSLLYAASFWGLVWYPLRYLEQAGISGTWLNLISYASACVVMLPLILRASAWRVRPSPGWLLLLALSAGWANVAFVLAVLQGEVVRVLLLFYLSPVWATLLGWLLLRERPEWITLLTIPLGLLGAVAMLWAPGLGLPWPLQGADWLALTAGLAFALSNVATRQMARVSVRVKTFAAWLGVVLIAGLLIGVAGEPLPAVTPMAWGGAILLGALGFFTVTLGTVYGVTHMPVQRSAVIMLFEIVAGGLSAWWLAGEAMGLREWLGGALIVTSGVLAAMRSPD